MIQLRPYQNQAVNCALDFFNGSQKGGALQILPTGSGKSIIIANIAKALNEPTIILQPSVEILQQNYAKFTGYGYRAGIYSASAGYKIIDKTTFATIGSIIKKKHLFKGVKYIIVDECHLVNPKISKDGDQGMYSEFIRSFPEAKLLGMTATPYRLSSSLDGAMLKFLTRTKPRIFHTVNYYVQNNVLFDAGHLAKLEYFSFNVVDRRMLRTNTSGTDFTDASLRAYYRQINMPQITIGYANRLLAKRKNLLIFCSLIEEAEKVVAGIPGAVILTGDTEKGLRATILKKFKNGDIKCVVNVGVLTTGFDYPELECVLMARSTMSLSIYYQIIGRGMRPHPNKQSCWFVDLGGNIDFFGKIETMKIEQTSGGLFFISNNGKPLTNVIFSKN